jgi:hypothetical protein
LAGGVLLALALAVGSALPKTALAEDPASPRLISVTGEALLQVKPDMAAITFGVQTQAATAQDAQKDNAGRMTAVINALVAKGIAKDDIQTSNFSLHPVYEWQGERDSKQVLVGYRCSNNVIVRLKDIANIGPVIDAATEAGANNIGGISFGLLDPKPQQDALLAEAVKNAREKAEIMAKAAGVNIISVYTISDGYSNVSPVVERSMMMDSAKGASTPIEPGSLTIRASVQVQYSF